MSTLRSNMVAPSRRGLLEAGLAGGFLLALHLPARAVNEPEQLPGSTEGCFTPNAFIRIDHSGKTTFVMPQVEMGRGIYTAVAMILAGELDADFTQVTLEHVRPSDKLYGNPFFQITRSTWTRCQPCADGGGHPGPRLRQAGPGNAHLS